MDFYMKLPRRKREFTLFLFVLSLISMNIIAPLITCFEVNFSLQTWAHTFRIMPMLWPCVVATVLITYKPAGFLTRKLTVRGDSFRAEVTLNILETIPAEKVKALGTAELSEIGPFLKTHGPDAPLYRLQKGKLQLPKLTAEGEKLRFEGQ